MEKRDIIVMGASAGGVNALVDLVASLPADFDASIFLVLHVSPSSPSLLPDILSRSGPLKAKHPHDGEKIKSGNIYVAPPDHHLILDNDSVLVKKGPKENRFRPSIDALFRSAAYMYGSRVIGIVLSGLMDDGTSGLWSVKRLGGVSIIQDPRDARFPDMPLNALEQVEVDYKLPVSEMASKLKKLISEPVKKSPAISSEEKKRFETEITIATQDNAFEMGILNMGDLTPFTCPECHGSLVSIQEGKRRRYRCHTGHAYTSSALLDSVTKTIEENLWNAVRGLEETVMLLENTGKQFEESGQKREAKQFLDKAKETRRKSQEIRKSIFEQERLSEDIKHNGKNKN